MARIQILVIEEDPAQSKLMASLLEEVSHTVEVAENAESAVEILRSFHPDLVLVDLDLSGKDGLELTRELRLKPIHATTLIIALTADADRSDLARVREAGCDGSISKPIDTATFARRVLSYIGGAGVIEAEVPSDSGDLMTEIRNRFLAEGLVQCDAILKQLNSGSGGAIGLIERALGRWAGAGGTLGFPEISNQARTVEQLLTSVSLEHEELVKNIETARRRFCAAARHEPKLSQELMKGLMDVRIGLVNFTEAEGNRIRTAAQRAKVRIVIEQMDAERVDHQNGYNALIVNECGLSPEAALRRRQWSIPAVFIGSRASLESLSQLPSSGSDLLIAPWEAEEVLIRLYRLMRNTEPRQPTGDPSRIPRRRPRVLIADDDPDLVALVLATLGQFGMDCDIARSGKQTLDAVRRKAPDAIVLDVNMIDLDGFQILKKLRDNLSTKSIPVLLLTARSQESDITLGFASGANDYVVKPFQPSDLVRRVEEIISAAHKPHSMRPIHI